MVAEVVVLALGLLTVAKAGWLPSLDLIEQRAEQSSRMSRSTCSMGSPTSRDEGFSRRCVRICFRLSK